MCGGTKHKQSNKVTQNTQRAVVSGRNTKAGGWWLGLGTDCWVGRRKIVFLPPPLSKMLCMDGTVASHNSKQNKQTKSKGIHRGTGCGGSWITPHLFGGWNTRKGHERDGGMFKHVTRPQ